MAADADAAAGQLTQVAEAEPPTADPKHDGHPAPEPAATQNAAHADVINTHVGHASHRAAPAGKSAAGTRLALALGVAAVLALGAVSGWLGFAAYQSHRTKSQEQLFISVGRQVALNLTTIDWQHADTDIQRILDSATGTFYDDFSKRQQPFLDVVKKAQSKSVGTITEAGMESQSGEEGQVIVAVTVKTSNLGAAQQQPRAWRMRITVRKNGDGAKVDNVEFVP